jgi:hypothetical protein
MFRVIAFLLLAGCVSAADAPSFTVSAPPQVRIGSPIIITVQLTDPTADVVMFYRAIRQSDPKASITLVKDPCRQTVCYVWAETSAYEIEVEGVIRTDAEARAVKRTTIHVFRDPGAPRLPPPPLDKPDDPFAPETPPEQPPPKPPTDQPKPPTDGDLGGLFGLGPKVRDKINELVPEEYRDLAGGLADVFRKAAEEVIDGKISPLNAAKRLKELNGTVLTNDAARAAWKPMLDWLSKELTTLATSGKLTSVKDVVAALSEISLGFKLATIKE